MEKAEEEHKKEDKAVKSNERKDKQRCFEVLALEAELTATIGNHRAISYGTKTLCGTFRTGKGPIKRCKMEKCSQLSKIEKTDGENISKKTTTAPAPAPIPLPYQISIKICGSEICDLILPLAQLICQKHMQKLGAENGSVVSYSSSRK